MIFPRPSQLAAALLLAWSTAALSLSSDSQQPIHVRADYAMVDEQMNVSIYTGNVTIDQGSLHIAADRVKIVTDDVDVIQIIASSDEGSTQLAHYEQKPDEDEKVEAEARQISYLVQEERLHLTGTAHLLQARDRFSGELLFYDIGRGIVNLSRGEKEKVHMIIQPKTQPPPQRKSTP